MMKIAILTVDNRESGNPAFGSAVPHFGTAPNALLSGFQEFSNEVEVHVVCCANAPLPGAERLAPNIYYHSIQLPKWSFLRTLHQGPIRAVRRKLKELEVDLVHAQGTERWCAISASFCNLPRILTIHGNLRLINRVTPLQPRFYWKLQEALETFAIPRFDGVVAITNYTRENIEDLAGKTWVVPNAVDREFFEIRRQPKAIPEILVVANIQERKNQNAFIDAVTPLASSLDFRVRFFGAGGRDDDYGREFFRRLDQHHWCTYEGMKSRSDLREAFQRASLLVLPTLEDNCPMSVLEAMAAGVPVMASNVGGVPDLLENRETGLFCDPSSAESMCSGLQELLAKPGWAEALAEKARTVALRRFHPHAIAAAHLDIYRNLLKEKRGTIDTSGDRKSTGESMAVNGL